MLKTMLIQGFVDACKLNNFVLVNIIKSRLFSGKFFRLLVVNKTFFSLKRSLILHMGCFI
jgi:hypothetical protein